jgi:2-furoyl-CoA dehydrogenase FAD binding subunit
VKPAPFAYRRPGSLAEALSALASETNAKVLAGGQSLVPLLSMRLAAPAVLVDINGVPGLAGVEVSDDGVRVGALARHADVLASQEARRVQPLLAMALSHVAHATIRNRGTTVGSIVHADAAAEMPVVLKLLGGSVEAESVAGRRTIAADDLFLGPLESSLRPDEIAVSAFFPALAPGAGVAFDEIARRHGDYALCGVAALVRVDGDRVTEARAGYLSVNELPTVVDLTDVLAGHVVSTSSTTEALASTTDEALASTTDEALAAAGDVALAGLDPAEDIHATAAYRAQLVRVLTARVLRAAYDDALTRSTGSAGSTTEGNA